MNRIIVLNKFYKDFLEKLLISKITLDSIIEDIKAYHNDPNKQIISQKCGNRIIKIHKINVKTKENRGKEKGSRILAFFIVGRDVFPIFMFDVNEEKIYNQKYKQCDFLLHLEHIFTLSLGSGVHKEYSLQTTFQTLGTLLTL